MMCVNCRQYVSLSLTTKFSRPQPSHYINKGQGMGSSTVLDHATHSEAALLWKSQHSHISAELFQLFHLISRQALLLVSVTTVGGYKILKITLWFLLLHITNLLTDAKMRCWTLIAFDRDQTCHTVSQNQLIIKMTLHANHDYICVKACAWVYCYSL